MREVSSEPTSSLAVLRCRVARPGSVRHGRSYGVVSHLAVTDCQAAWNNVCRRRQLSACTVYLLHDAFCHTPRRRSVNCNNNNNYYYYYYHHLYFTKYGRIIKRDNNR